MRNLTSGVVVLVIVAWFSCGAAADLVWENISRENISAQCVVSSSGNAKIIFAGFKGSILKSDDGGKSWSVVLRLGSKSRKVNQLAYDFLDSCVIYAAADNGLYRSQNSGGSWERIFRPKQNLESQCTAIIGVAPFLCLGTKSGVFISRDAGRSWNKETTLIGNQEILNIDLNLGVGKIIYLAARGGIFKATINDLKWEKLSVVFSQEVADTVDLDSQGVGETAKGSRLCFVKADNNNPKLLYYSTTQGVYQSTDQGETWEKLTEYGLLNRNIKMLCLNQCSELFALSATGVFLYQNERWQEISLSLIAGGLNFLNLDWQGNLYLAAEAGLFKLILNESRSALNLGLISEYQKFEPKIRELQLAAIKYAEVSPEKITLWRSKASQRAIFPQISIGVDRNSSDLWHWEGGSTTRNDDDILRRGKDTIDWDITLSWDLGDLIWSDTQTSIDVRSKLMVELRDDILDQVNKLYFERLRVKSELDSLTIENRSKRFEKRLKLEELAASLDALTGGFYSQQLQSLALRQTQ